MKRTVLLPILVVATAVVLFGGCQGARRDGLAAMNQENAERLRDAMRQRQAQMIRNNNLDNSVQSEIDLPSPKQIDPDEVHEDGYKHREKGFDRNMYVPKYNFKYEFDWTEGQMEFNSGGLGD